MRVVIAVLALAGCTQVFDLEDTHVPGEHDAKCPPIGETPRFTRALTQVLPRSCESYNYAGTRRLAVASCIRSFQTAVEIGPVDEPLEPAPGIPPHDTGTTAYISQDDQRIYFASLDADRPDPFVIDVYRRQPDNTWLVDPALQFRSGSFSLGTPLRLNTIAAAQGHDRTVLVDGAKLVELVVDSGWTPVRTTSASDLGVDAVTGFSMTADGLRATFYGIVTPTETTAAQYYTDRRSVDDPFRRGEPLDVSSYPGAFMTDDCGRIYMSGVGSIFYARQAR